MSDLLNKLHVSVLEDSGQLFGRVARPLQLEGAVA